MRLAVLLAASLACVGIGFAKSAALSAHVKDLETLQKIIQYLRGEIVTAASPLPDAFWETGRRMRDPYRDFLQDISEDMRRPDAIEIMPLFARLSAADQHKVFESHTHQRIVIATNVAETSLTVPGIRYVVDPGTARISRYLSLIHI